MNNLKSIESPVKVRHCVEKGDELKDTTLYRQLRGSMIYLITQSDFAYLGE